VKETEERYRRASINWGSVAVHPSDLAEAYQELAATRTQYVGNSSGTEGSRTTSLAHAIVAIKGLFSNGYNPSEVASILVSLVPQILNNGPAAEDDTADEPTVKEKLEELRASLNSQIDDALNSFE